MLEINEGGDRVDVDNMFGDRRGDSVFVSLVGGLRGLVLGILDELGSEELEKLLKKFKVVTDSNPCKNKNSPQPPGRRW